MKEAIKSRNEWTASEIMATDPVMRPAISLITIKTLLEKIDSVAVLVFMFEFWVSGKPAAPLISAMVGTQTSRRFFKSRQWPSRQKSRRLPKKPSANGLGLPVKKIGAYPKNLQPITGPF
jgi:hypothetical protein